MEISTVVCCISRVDSGTRRIPSCICSGHCSFSSHWQAVLDLLYFEYTSLTGLLTHHTTSNIFCMACFGGLTSGFCMTCFGGLTSGFLLYVYCINPPRYISQMNVNAINSKKSASTNAVANCRKHVASQPEPCTPPLSCASAHVSATCYMV